MFKRLRQIAQLVTYKELRNGILGVVVILGGLGLAGITAYAHMQGNVQLAGIAATASLVFVFLIIVFVIPPLARNASAEATQLNLPFEFTTGGAIFLGLLVIVAFAAFNTSNNLLFLVLSFITAALVVGFFVGHFGLKRLDVKMRFPETVYADEPTPIVVSLHSRKRFFPTFSVTAEVRGRHQRTSDIRDRLTEFLPEKWAERISKPPLVKHTLDYFVHIPRSGEFENQLDHVFERRGRFLIRDFELSTKFPFALFRHRRRLPAQRAEIVVFPKSVEIPTGEIKMPIESGTISARKKGTGRDLLGLREYQPLDDLRHIDWKATARTQRMIVRDFAAEDELRIVLILDTRIIRSEKERALPLRKEIENIQHGIVTGESIQRINDAVGKASYILEYFYGQGAELSVMNHDGITEMAEGNRHYFICMRKIATAMPIYVDRFERGDFEAAVEQAISRQSEAHIYLLRSKHSATGFGGLDGVNTIEF